MEDVSTLKTIKFCLSLVSNPFLPVSIITQFFLSFDLERLTKDANWYFGVTSSLLSPSSLRKLPKNDIDGNESVIPEQSLRDVKNERIVLSHSEFKTNVIIFLKIQLNEMNEDFEGKEKNQRRALTSSIFSRS